MPKGKESWLPFGSTLRGGCLAQEPELQCLVAVGRWIQKCCITNQSMSGVLCQIEKGRGQAIWCSYLA